MKAKAELGLVSAIIVAGFAALVFNRQVKIVREVHAEETEACSNETLLGRYAFTGQGFLTNSNTLPALTGAFAPVADVGVFESDGQGKLSGSDTISDGGQIIPRTFTGSYTLNSDCRGTAALNFNSGLAVDIAIALDDRGHEARALQTNPQGAVFTVVARSVH